MKRGTKSGGWKISLRAPSKGRLQYRKRIPLSATVVGVPPSSRSEIVARMFDNLIKKGWVFTFEVDACSPHGYHNVGKGPTAEEAFMRAFGMWKRAPVVPMKAPDTKTVQVPRGKRARSVPLNANGYHDRYGVMRASWEKEAA